MAEQKNQVSDKQDARNISPLERGVVAVSALLVIGLIGFLLYQAITDQGGKPEFALSVASIDPQRPGYVDVTVQNQGDGAAADVEVEGTRPTQDGQEVSTARLDYSPAQSELSVTLIFSEPVAEDQLALRVTGYAEP